MKDKMDSVIFSDTINKDGMRSSFRVTQLTSIDEASIASSATCGREVSVNWNRMLHCEHSPIRAVMYRIEMDNIPSFVSVHFVRHKTGVEHFVKSLREDRGGSGNEDRWSKVNHTMIANAQSVMNMARRRLCHKASRETVETMRAVKDAFILLDPVLQKHLVPMCVYRGNICHEYTSCGISRHYTKA